MDSIELRVEGDPAQMNVSGALTSLGAMARLITEWESDSPRWRPVQAHVNSLAITMAPISSDLNVLERAYAQASAVMDGLQSLARSAQIPLGWSAKKVRLLRKAGKPMDATSGISGLTVNIPGQMPVSITPLILEHAIEAVRVRSVSYGSAIGKLDIVNLRARKPRIQLLDQATGADVKCEFPADLLEEGLSRVGQVVAVEGLLSRNSEGEKVSIEVTSIREVERPLQPPIHQLVGILGGEWTGDMDSVEWVRQQRD